MWFVIPITLAIVLLISVPFWIEFKTIKYSFVAYLIGSVFSCSAILYLIGVIIIILRTKGGYLKDLKPNEKKTKESALET